MNRRDALAAMVALGTAAGPCVARAQSKPSTQGRTLGVLAPGSSQDVERLFLGVFRAELKLLGWIEGQNLVVESAFADYKTERLSALAEQLVHKRVDVIWAITAGAAIAAAASAATFAARERITGFALHNRLPSACASTSMVEAGGLLSYGAANALTESVARGAKYAEGQQAMREDGLQVDTMRMLVEFTP